MIFSSLQKNRSCKGFTLLELVVVVGIFIVLLSVIIITLNPSEQYRVASNEKRIRDVTKIIKGIDNWLKQEENDFNALNEGNGIPQEPKNIGSGEEQINICNELVPDYLDSMPFDNDYTNTYFNNCKDYYTGYDIVSVTSPELQIIISAPNSGYSKSVTVSKD